MGVLGNNRPLANLLSAEGVEAEEYTNPNRLLQMRPPMEAMTPGANQPGVMAPPLMPAGKVPIHEIRMPDPTTGDVNPEAAAQMAKRTPAVAPPKDPAAALSLLRDFYTRKAGQMQLPTKKRIQPRPEDFVIDNDYATPAPERATKKLSDHYPRHTEGAVMPLNDRARPLIDNADAIATRYADAIRKSGVMESDVRLFYHVDGPIYRAARKAGLSHGEAMQWLDDFSQFVAATSPQTQTEPNILNASSVMAKTAQGIPHRQILGPGTTKVNPKTGAVEPGIGERGYPMYTGEGGLHGQLADRVIAGEGISHDTNTKPSFFGPNMAGNRSGVTVDIHVIRGILMTLNDLHPGSLPNEWFSSPEALAAYRANPAGLTFDMLNDTIASAQVGPKGASIARQVEYPVFADIIHKVAQKLKIPDEDVADAQAMGWFGMGDRTNLGSAPKTAVDILNERISVTAQMMGKSPAEIARMLFNRQIPLASLFGVAAGVGAMLGEQQPDQSQGDDIVRTMTKAPPSQMTPEQFKALTDYMRGIQG